MIKIFVYLLAIICACNATFLNLFADKGGARSAGNYNNYNAFAKPPYRGDHINKFGQVNSYASGNHHSHSPGGSPHVIKVILEQGSSAAADNSGGFPYTNDQSYALANHGVAPQIFKIITQSSGSPAPVHIDYASRGLPYGSSQVTSGYSEGGFHNYNFQLYAILPHILEFILHNNGANGFGSSLTAGGGKNLNSQLVTHFGQKGRVIIIPSNEKNKEFFAGGHVVQKGVLKLKRLEATPDHSNLQAHAYPSPGYVVQKPAQHDHGW